MASHEAGKGGQTVSSVLHYLKIFTLNLWRRLVILWHYLVIFFHRQRLCRAWGRLGQRVHEAVDQGEVNPMLTDEVKDSLAKAQAVQAKKDRHYEAVAALREKIRASRTEAAPVPQKTEEAPPPQEAEPAPPPEAETAPEEKSEPIILGESEPGPAPEPETEVAKEASEPEKPQS